MAQILTQKDVTLLTVNRQIILLDLKNAETKQIIDLPTMKQPAKVAVSDDSTAVEIDTINLANNDDEDDGDTKQPPSPIASNRILHAVISPNGDLLAVATADEKCLHIYRLSSGDVTDDDQLPFAELLSSRPLSRTSNAMRFSADSQQLFVADKTGDCFAFSCVDPGGLQAPGQCVLSHLSMVLGIVPTPSGGHVLSCDRDEKVRCTQYPRTTVIDAYCLGHTEYVAAIELLPTRPATHVLSASGDRTLRVWTYLDGKQVASFELPAAALRMAVRRVNDGRSHVAVSLFDHAEYDVVVYELSDGNADPVVPAAKQIGAFRLDGIIHVNSLQFDVHGDLLLATITKSDETAVFRLTAASNNDGYTLDALDALNAEIAAQAFDLLVPFNVEEISLLFKKKFDNIHDYQERKRRRIEEKNTSKTGNGNSIELE